MKRNPDGSVDIYFGPKAPAGKQANWIYTATGKAFFSAMLSSGMAGRGSDCRKNADQ